MGGTPPEGGLEPHGDPPAVGTCGDGGVRVGDPKNPGVMVWGGGGLGSR